MRKDNREAANESIRQAGDPAMLEDLLIYLAKRCNTAALESDVRELQITLNQKTAGQPQYAKSGDINVDVNFDRVRMCILGNAVGMVRDGTIDRLAAEVSPAVIQDKTGMMDRDRRIAEENERFWGMEVAPEVLKYLVQDLDRATNDRDREYIKRNIVCEAYAIVLSGRLPK